MTDYTRDKKQEPLVPISWVKKTEPERPAHLASLFFAHSSHTVGCRVFTGIGINTLVNPFCLQSWQYMYYSFTTKAYINVSLVFYHESFTFIAMNFHILYVRLSYLCFTKGKCNYSQCNSYSYSRTEYCQSWVWHYVTTIIKSIAVPEPITVANKSSLSHPVP